jgi:hypothetical protein
LDSNIVSLNQILIDRLGVIMRIVFKGLKHVFRVTYALLLLMVLISQISVQAQFSKIVVSADGSGDYLSVQEGIDNAADGDTVLIKPGIYVENVVINNRELVIMGDSLVNNHTDGFSTVIDGELNGGVFAITQGSIVLKNLKIQNGYSQRGGGIFGAQMDLFLGTNLHILDNYSDDGGGIFLQQVLKATVRNSLVEYNTAVDAGGIFSSELGELHLINSIFANNLVSSTDGGGINIDDTDKAIIVNVTVAQNVIPEGRYGSGLNTDMGVLDSLFVINSIFADNKRGDIVDASTIVVGGGKNYFYNNFSNFDMEGFYTGSNNVFDINSPFQEATDWLVHEFSNLTNIGVKSINVEGRTIRTPEFDLFGLFRDENLIDAGAVQMTQVMVNDYEIPGYVPIDGLIAWYPFNGNANDESGNGYNGTVNGASLTLDRDGVENSAYNFDGVDDFIDIPFDFEDGATLESTSFWFRFKPNNIEGERTLWNKDGSSKQVVVRLLGDKSIALAWAFTNDFFSIKSEPNVILLNSWNDVLIINKINGIKIIVNGDEVLDVENSTQQTTLSFSSSGSCGTQYGINRIGLVKKDCNPRSYFSGEISEMAIWNRGLNESEINEIQNLYTEGNIPPQAIHVSIPDQDVYTIDTTYTSVYLEDVPEAGFNAFQYALSFDPDSIDVEILDSEFTLSTDYELTMNEEAAGYILIAGAGNTPITTDGNLTDIKIYYKTGGVSTLAIEELMFNEGEPMASSAPSRIDAELLVCGDVTADNTVSALDAAHILRHTVRLAPQYPLEGRDFIAGDVTSNGAVTAYDAYFVLRDIVGMGSGLSCTSTIYNLKEAWTPKLSWSLYSKGADLVTPIYLSEDTPEVYALEVEVPNGAEVKVVGLPGDWNTLEYTNEGTQYLSMYGLTPLSSPELIWERTTGQIMEARVRVNESQWQTIEQEMVGDQVLPQQYVLSQNYPNPFNPNTQISYALPEASQVTLEVFNSLGQKVATLVDAQQSAGYHTANFDASQLSSGVYLYKLSTPGFSQTKKMLLVK